MDSRIIMVSSSVRFPNAQPVPLGTVQRVWDAVPTSSYSQHIYVGTACEIEKTLGTFFLSFASRVFEYKTSKARSLAMPGAVLSLSGVTEFSMNKPLHWSGCAAFCRLQVSSR